MKKLMIMILSLAIIISAQVPSVFSSAATSQKKVNLKWYYIGSETPDENIVYDKFNQVLSAKTGISVNFQRFDWGTYDDKMKMILASGETFDVCFTANWVNNFFQKVTQGAFVDMYPLIDKYVPGFRRALPDFVFKAGEINGKLYGMSNYQSIFKWPAFAMQKKIALKYGITADKVKKFDDIEKFLPAIKAGERRLYPIRAGYEPLWNEVEQINGTATYIRTNESGYKVYTYTTTDKNDIYFKHQLKLRDWLKKGYIRKDQAFLKDGADQADKRALKYAIWIDPYSPGSEASAKDTYGAEIVFFPIGKPFIGMKAGAETLNAISRTSKNPDSAMKVIALLNTDKELHNIISFGIEGKHYKKISANVIEQPEDNRFNAGIPWEFGSVFNNFLLKGQSEADFNKTKELNNTAQRSKIMGFVPNLEPIKREIALVEAADKEFWGREYFDLNNDEKFMKMKKQQYDKVVKAGMLKVQAEMQKQVDAYVKLNKLR